ncbi:DUF2993 domain-containing protein [Microbacterium sp. LjRoot45]|uniref:LmeA family phospholipid-binding protein n=1 Tax=Microbacterium sp. LjRoot45 TaxID=3342329 RepID=UPI003ECECA26
MSADSQPTQPLPDPGAQWVLSSPTPSPRRRRRWAWIVALIVVVALAIGAWFAGDAIARSIVKQTIREQAITQLSLPADQQIDVELDGAVLLGLIVGNLPEVRVASDDVPLGQLTADISVVAQDVPVHGGGDWSGAHATATLDEAQLEDLLATLDDFPADTVEIDAPDVAVTFELNALVTKVPVGVALTPRAENGDLVLSPASLRIADAEISAESIVQQFGALASTVVRDWDVCIAQYLPAAVTLTGVRVEPDAVVADFEIDSAILRDASAQENGTCS